MANGGRDTILAFLLGAVAVGVTALLLAPDRGSETRRRIRSSARDFKESADAKARQLAETAHAGADHVTESTRTQIGAVRDAVAEGRAAYRREVAKEDE